MSDDDDYFEGLADGAIFFGPGGWLGVIILIAILILWICHENGYL